MMIRIFLLGGLLLSSLPASAAVDLSTPKSAAKSFYEAMGNSDTAAMRDCLLVDADPQQQQLAGVLVDVIVAGKHLADAAKNKFGSANDKLGAGALSHEDASAIDAATQKDDGDESILQLSQNVKPLKFRKTATGWKLVLTDYAGGKPETIAEQIKLMTSLTAAMNDTADEINTGHYPSSADAEAEIQQRFSEVMAHRYHPATTQSK
ncbi:MAG TPA: hypothetical protein VHS31_07475 [Tepidisphaeraceae bacterium]|nr:hypothetical protein [Tepidisphaeraceae bacterium]